VGRRETRGRTDRAVDVDQAAADTTDQVVVVVPDPVFIASWRSRRLNAPEEAFGYQDAEGVVHRLQRDCTDLGPDDLGHALGRDVRLTRDGPHDGESLRRDLNAALTEEVRRLRTHLRSIDQILE
jgi:hypothetical protein